MNVLMVEGDDSTTTSQTPRITVEIRGTDVQIFAAGDTVTFTCSGRSPDSVSACN